MTFDVVAGEVLGVAALDGGASALLQTLAGRTTPRSGKVELPSRIGFVPEDRQHEALVPAFTLAENVALKDAGQRRGRMDWSAIERQAGRLLEEYAVRSDGPKALAETLSGGNQQRFVLARELDENPPLLVLENPTQGLDVDAASVIHDRVRTAAGAGTAVVFYSSDIDELTEISHRVLVIRSSGAAFTEPERESIGHLLLEN
jgi:simple sugar transport system ATP-binding protein